MDISKILEERAAKEHVTRHVVDLQDGDVAALAHLVTVMHQMRMPREPERALRRISAALSGQQS